MPNNEDSKEEGRKFHEFVKTLSDEQIQEGNVKQLQKTREDYSEFLDAYKDGICSFCSCGLSTFSRNDPCFHWLTIPPGFRAKDIRQLGDKYGLRRIQAYLHWISSAEEFAKGINNLAIEGKSGAICHETIRWKNVEFTILCGETDYNGHGKNPHSQRPHYHLQIVRDGNIICKFSQQHIPLSHMDIVHIEAERAPDTIFRRIPAEAVTMEDLFGIDPEEMMEHMSSADNEDEAMFKLNTLVFADEGHKISGDDIADAIERAKANGTPIAHELKTLEKATVNVQVTPGDGVIEKAERLGGRSKKSI